MESALLQFPRCQRFESFVNSPRSVNWHQLGDRLRDVIQRCCRVSKEWKVVAGYFDIDARCSLGKRDQLPLVLRGPRRQLLSETSHWESIGSLATRQCKRLFALRFPDASGFRGPREREFFTFGRSRSLQSPLDRSLTLPFHDVKGEATVLEHVLNERGSTWALRYWRMHAPSFKPLTVEEFERLSQDERMDYLIRAIADLRGNINKRE